MSQLKYVKTSPELFSDPWVWSLSMEYKLLWCYVCHPPNAELHGIWRYDVDQIAAALKLPHETIRQGLELFETADRIYTTTTHIWVKRFFRFQQLSFEAGKKVIYSVFMLEDELPEVVNMWMRFHKIKSWHKLKDIPMKDDPPEVQGLIDPAYAGYVDPNYKGDM